MPEPTTTRTLEALEIFSTGNWHGEDYTTADLDGIVEAFPAVGFKPPLKLGHSENQKLLNASGMPAAGWINRIYRKGQKLLADVVDIPSKVYDLLQKKAYDRVSVELYMDYEDTPNKKQWPIALKALALLGAEIPEVTNLDAIASLYNDEEGHKFRVVLYDQQNQKEGNDLNKHREDIGMTDQEKKDLESAQKAIKEFEAKLAEKDTLLVKMGKSNEDMQKSIDELAGNLSTERTSRRKDRINQKVREFVTARKISPAQSPYLETLLNAMPSTEEVTVKFQRDDKEVEDKMTAEIAFDKFIDAQPQYIASGEKTQQGVDTDDTDAKVLAFCKDNNWNPDKDNNYAKALKEISKKGGK